MKVEIWSDFACPWCALGIHRLAAARRQFAHGDEITVVHRAFELDPGAPARRSQTTEELLAAKYGMSHEQIRAGHERLTALGRDVGMEFRFDRVQLGNTFDAHRLAQIARGTEAEEAVVSGLFSAYFTEGKLLSDHQVLEDVAAAAGLDPAVAHLDLESGAHGDDVRADEAVAHRRGITGVPYFLIDDRWAVPGAQDVETLVQALDQAWELAQGMEQAGAAAT